MGKLIGFLMLVFTIIGLCFLAFVDAATIKSLKLSLFGKKEQKDKLSAAAKVYNKAVDLADAPATTGATTTP